MFLAVVLAAAFASWQFQPGKGKKSKISPGLKHLLSLD